MTKPIPEWCEKAAREIVGGMAVTPDEYESCDRLTVSIIAREHEAGCLRNQFTAQTVEFSEAVRELVEAVNVMCAEARPGDKWCKSQRRSRRAAWDARDG